jgi:dihydroorotate dehydrogenase electron transfer subunit
MDKSGPGRTKAPVIDRKDYGLLTAIVLEAPLLDDAKPGQFVHVYCGNGEGRILRRPYSIYDVRDGTLTLLVKVVGGGSAWLEERDIGDSLDLLGPLGRPFDQAGIGVNLLVAGGTGIVPMHFLYRQMRAADIEAVLLWGMEGGEDYRGLPDILKEDTNLRMACEDGAFGLHGKALELLDEFNLDEYDGIYACGPRGMLVDLAEKVDIKVLKTFQVSLEERMACGVGACRGCAVPSSSSAKDYLMVCSDGPVFNGKELDWERIKG